MTSEWMFFVHFISCSSAYHHRYWSALYFIYWQHNKKPIHSTMLHNMSLCCSVENLLMSELSDFSTMKKHSWMIWNVMSGNETWSSQWIFIGKFIFKKLFIANFDDDLFGYSKVWEFPSDFASCWNLKWFYAISQSHRTLILSIYCQKMLYDVR